MSCMTIHWTVYVVRNLYDDLIRVDGVRRTDNVDKGVAQDISTHTTYGSRCTKQRQVEIL